MKHRPVSEPMLLKVLREAASAGHVIDVHGALTKGGWRLDRGPAANVEVDMTGLSGVITHDHGDMTATVYAGTPLTAFQTAVAERGQRLAIDPAVGPHGEATIGGIFAADDSGPGRIAYGSLRELCIGARFMLADGTSAKSGSKVIKNVAGFDLCKLLCGSRGTLAIVTELTVRLHPVAAFEHTVIGSLSLTAAAKAALQIAKTTTADAITLTGGEHGRIAIRLTGPRSLVRAQAQTSRDTLAEAGAIEIADLEEPESRLRWAETTEDRRASAQETTVAVSLPSSQTEAFTAALAAWWTTASVSRRLVADPTIGFWLLHLRAEEPTDVAQAVGALRAIAQDHRGHARLRDRTDGVLEHVDPYGPLPSSLPVMERLKKALDPDGRLAPGRYLTNP